MSLSSSILKDPATSVATSVMASSQLQQHLHQDLGGRLSVEEKMKQKRIRLYWTVLIGTFAGASVVTALAAIYLEASLIAYLAFGIPLFTGPGIIIQRRRINKLPTLKSRINACRRIISILGEQNVLFYKENERLAAQVAQLRNAEQKLDDILAKTGGSSNEMRRLVAEYGAIQLQMKKLKDARQLQDLLSQILRSDMDGDFHISEKEMNHLLLRLQALNMADQVRLRRAFQMSKAVSATTLFRACLDIDDQNEINDREFMLEEGFGVHTCHQTSTCAAATSTDIAFGYDCMG